MDWYETHLMRAAENVTAVVSTNCRLLDTLAHTEAYVIELTFTHT